MLMIVLIYSLTLFQSQTQKLLIGSEFQMLVVRMENLGLLAPVYRCNFVSWNWCYVVITQM